MHSYYHIFFIILYVHNSVACTVWCYVLDYISFDQSNKLNTYSYIANNDAALLAGQGQYSL